MSKQRVHKPTFSNYTVSKKSSPLIQARPLINPPQQVNAENAQKPVKTIKTQTAEEWKKDNVFLKAIETLEAQQQREIQAKLTVGEPGDKYEQEADAMASKVLSMPDTAVQRESEEKVQTKPLANGITPVVQRAARTNGGVQTNGNLESRLNSSKGGGSPLPHQVRNFMEPRFGADFSRVRVHTDNNAVQMSRELGAQAFTHGSDIYYGEGKAPGNNELTAHELTHVVQQTGAVQQQKKPQKPTISSKEIPVLGGIAPKSNVLSHVQSLGGTAGNNSSIYRQEILHFQRENPSEKIAASQQQVLESTKTVNIKHKDNSPTIRKQGTPPPQNSTVATFEGLAQMAEKLGQDKVTMKSYDDFQNKGQAWFFSPNGNLTGAYKKPDSFFDDNTWLNSRQALQRRIVILNLAGFSDATAQLRKMFSSGGRRYFQSIKPRLQQAYQKWPANRYAVFQAPQEGGGEDRNTCNIFVGDALFLAGIKINGKYPSAENIYNGASGLKSQDKPGRGVIASWSGHLEIVTKVQADGTFCSRGGYRTPIGGEKCGRTTNGLKFFLP
ncbi:MAG TPA: DUF4157 domain-containing protein [Nostocaceae cyanobacterium]|nr:DUF4157 domain-containing protein [Nostocaceae cyanobacterium]